jgi:hypothetical protein
MELSDENPLTNKDRCDPKNEVAFYPLFKKPELKCNGYCFNGIREDEWRVKIRGSDLTRKSLSPVAYRETMLAFCDIDTVDSGGFRKNGRQNAFGHILSNDRRLSRIPRIDS